VKKPKKAAKGALCSEIQEKEVELWGGQDHGGMGMIQINKVKMTNVRCVDLDHMVHILSILSQFPMQIHLSGWCTQNAGLQKDLKSKKAPEIVNPFQSGGLNDEDAISCRPSFPHHHAAVPLVTAVQYPQNLQHDHSCKNEVC
jgi:hypothetical protein